MKVGKNAGESWNGCGWCSINEKIQRKNDYVVSRLKEILFYGVNCSIVCAKIQFMTAKQRPEIERRLRSNFCLPFCHENEKWIWKAIVSGRFDTT